MSKESENETVEAIIQDMRAERYAVSGMPDLHMRDYAYRIESAWWREKAELESKLSNTETARKFFARRIDSAKKRISELSEPRPRRNCDRFHGDDAVNDALCEFYKESSDNSRSALVRWMLAPVAEGGFNA